MIYSFIYTKKTIMRTAKDGNLYWRILTIVAVDVQLKLATYLLSIDSSRHINISLIQQG